MQNTQESQIENRLTRLVRERGGLCYKFVSPGNRGVPDRIVITPVGRIIFVELKKKDGRLSKLQRWQISEMRRRGCDVRMIRGLDDVYAFVEEVMPNEV